MLGHNADKDERLSDATATSVIELGQVNDLLNLNSLLFKKAKWKVCCLNIVHAPLFLFLLLNMP